MKEKYKIGDISKLLGIPIQTLHYYEKCGFVKPSQNQQNHYRYYDTWDVNFLLDSKYLHSFRFANSEIAQMIHTDDLSRIYSRMDRQEKELLDTIYRYQTVLDELHAEKARIAKGQKNIGVFRDAESPRLFFTRYRRNNSYDIFADSPLPGKHGQSSAEIPQISRWLEYMPFVKATFTVSAESLRTDRTEDLIYWWGYSIPVERAARLQVPTQAPVEYLPGKKSIYTVFTAHEAHTFAAALLTQVLRPIREKGYEIADNPIGRLLVRFHKEERYTRYFEIWVPIQ